MAKRRLRARPGQVFQVPLADNLVGYGQILAKIRPNPLFVAMFDLISPASETLGLEAVVNSKPVLLGNTLDAKIWHGHWPVIGSREPCLDGIPFPKFKVSIGRSNAVYVISYDGNKRRRATEDEEALLELRTTVSPALFERALKAFHGIEEWNEKFDKLRVANVNRSSLVEI